MTQALLRSIRSLANKLSLGDVDREMLIAQMVEFYDELGKIEAAHQARVTELLQANNAEVERRRTAEASKAESDRRYRVACDREADLILERNAANEDADKIAAKADQLRKERDEAINDLCRWRSAFQSVTPGGSEFMSPEAVRAFMEQLKREAVAAKLDAARARISAGPEPVLPRVGA